MSYARHVFPIVPAPGIRHTYVVRTLYDLIPDPGIVDPKGTHKTKDYFKRYSRQRFGPSPAVYQDIKCNSTISSRLSLLTRHSNSVTCTQLSYFLRLFWAVRLVGIAAFVSFAALYAIICCCLNSQSKASSTRRTLLRDS